MKKILTVLLAAIALVSCTSNKSEKRPKLKALVLYYSQMGATKVVAEELQFQMDADIEAIEIENPYSGSYDETIERVKKEMATGELPVVKPIKADLSKYDVIFLGYPVWFGVAAPPIESLCKQVDFKGKMVVTFCTFGSGGLQASTAKIKKELPQAQVVGGYGVRNARLAAMPRELAHALDNIGFRRVNRTDEVAPQPLALYNMDKLHPVSDKERAIFDQACGDYQFPLGTPVAVVSRGYYDRATEYLYLVDCKDSDGKPAKSWIYVLVPMNEAAKPEFTQVVR